MAQSMGPMAVQMDDPLHPASVPSHSRNLLQLPPECVEAIVRRVLDIPTLFALLFVCKEMSAVAEKVIYEDPFRLTVGNKNTSFVHGRLLDRLLPLSPYEDEVFDRILHTLGHRRRPALDATDSTNATASTTTADSTTTLPPLSEETAALAAAIDASAQELTTHAESTSSPPKKQYKNALSHLRIFDYDVDMYNTTYFHPSAYMITRDIVDHYHLRWEPALRKVQSTVGWACFGHQLRQLQRLRIPIWDLERFLDQLPSLVNVRVLNFAATKVWPTNSHPEVAQVLVVDQLRIVVEFIKAFQLFHGSERPQQCEIFNLDMGLGGEEAKALERQFYALLPPLPSPTHLSVQNWPRMAARYEHVDLSQVTDITYTDTRVDWPDRQHLVLERCQSLEQLNCLGLERDMFIFRKTMPRGWCSISGLRLQCNGFIMRDLVDSAMVVLHGSLTTAIFTVRTTSITLLDPELTIGKHWPSFPVLQTLHIQAKETIFLHPRALHDAPKLKSLYLFDETNLYNPYTLAQLEPWRLPSLRSLYLQGMTAAAFHPKSLAGLPQLANATIKGVKMDARRYFMPRHSDNTPRGMRLAELWTWDWEMPALTNLRMEGELAYRFDFQWLEFCPQLTELSLKIGGHHRPMLLSPAITARARLRQQRGRECEGGVQEAGQGEGGEHGGNSGSNSKDTTDKAVGVEHQSCVDLWELEDVEEGKHVDWEALHEAERRGLLTRLACQPRIAKVDSGKCNHGFVNNIPSNYNKNDEDEEDVDKDEDDDDSDTSSLWIRSNLEHLELEGRWLMTDRLLQRLLFRNLRRLKFLALQGPKGYTRWGLLECTRRHRCLERVESSQMVTRADSQLLGLEPPEIRRWTRGGWRGGIQEWNTRPAREANRPRVLHQEELAVEGTMTTAATTTTVEASNGEVMVVGWDWEALDPEKTPRTKIAWWEQIDEEKEKKEKEDKLKNKNNKNTNTAKINAKAPVPKAQPLVPANGSAPTAATENDCDFMEDDGAPGPSSYVAGLILDEKERLPPLQQHQQSSPVEQERSITVGATATTTTPVVDTGATTATTTTTSSTNIDKEVLEQGYVVYQFMKDHFRFKRQGNSQQPTSEVCPE
ncbi:hypothetical protein DFQ26_007803 [Actinomortierella ambigua]|nr:hypothetical protein DFQ26_007803 [Actinomortierella ambigua]